MTRRARPPVTEHPTTCPKCGSTRLTMQTRDAWPTEAHPVPPPGSFGEWIECEACGHEWPADDEEKA